MITEQAKQAILNLLVELDEAPCVNIKLWRQVDGFYVKTYEMDFCLN
jgi:hypothetical protein